MSTSHRTQVAPAWLEVPRDSTLLDPGLWPATARRRGDGELELGGVGVRELIAEFGSPLYVIDEATVRARAAAVRTAFTAAFARIGASCELHYASKALLTIDIAQWMQDADLGLDVATGGELEVALAAGADPATIGMHGNNKSRAELNRAVTAGVGCIILDSLDEIDLLAEVAAAHNTTQAVMVRVNLGIHASTHDYLATSHEDQKFGITRVEAIEAVRRIRATPSLRLLGLHSHIGSQVYDPDGFGAAAERLLALRAELLQDGPVPVLNLGGGFGVGYVPSDTPPRIEELAEGIASRVAAAAGATKLPHFVVEPGRSIVAQAGVTLYTVGATKTVTVPDADGATRRYLAVDGGMSDNIRPALYGADYCVRLASRTSVAAPELVRVVGKHCESGDIVVPYDYLPTDVHAGDVLAVPVTGAYCRSLASTYNFVDIPALVAVRDGHARVLTRRVTITDLLGYDASWSGPANS